MENQNEDKKMYLLQLPNELMNPTSGSSRKSSRQVNNSTTVYQIRANDNGQLFNFDNIQDILSNNTQDQILI